MKNINISNNNKQLVINLISSLVAFSINLIISFFLSPYIVKTLGVEANGFVSLANNFIMYASLVTIALNSMAGRFITIAIHKQNYELANKYYNAVFGGNIIITLMFILPAIFCVYKLESLINIPINLIFDVKILFFLVFFNFFINTAVPAWGTAIFASNRMYLSSLRGMEANFIRIVTIIVLFVVFSPKVYFIGIAIICTTIYNQIFSKIYQKKLIPELEIGRKNFEWSYVNELIKSGIWNTVSQSGQLLLSGLDLLISNIFIGPIEMGVLALAKTLPNILINLSGTFIGVFTPSLTIDYAKGNKEALRLSLKQGMKLTGVLLTIPLSLLIIYGQEFYSLWLPSENSLILQRLTILTCFGLIFTSGTQCLFNVFTVTNKLKINSILILLSGVVSTTIVFILLKNTNMGIYAIAGVSSVISLIRNLAYVIPYSAKYLGFKWNSFFTEVLTSALSVILIVAVGIFLKRYIEISSWISLILICSITSIIGLLINIFIVLNKKERMYLLNILKSKIKIA